MLNAAHVLCGSVQTHTLTVSVKCVLLSAPPRQWEVKLDKINIHSIAHKEHKHTLIAVSVHF